MTTRNGFHAFYVFTQVYGLGLLYLSLGIACMGVAGFFLINGLLQFGASKGAITMMILAGILFQVTESMCFIGAAASRNLSHRWRRSLFLFGVTLLLFSIAVMTLAQKASLASGESGARANDIQQKHLQEQITQLDGLITTYQLNAENQSQSKYAQSRLSGQDSINRAADLIKERTMLISALNGLIEKRLQTSIDFFTNLETVTGLDAKKTEFWFLFLRSVLLELCGLIMLSFGSYQISRLMELRAEKAPFLIGSEEKLVKSLSANDAVLVVETINDSDTLRDVDRSVAESNPKKSAIGGGKNAVSVADVITDDIKELIDRVAHAYTTGDELTTLGQRAIMNYLRDKGFSVGSKKAEVIQNEVRVALGETAS